MCMKCEAIGCKSGPHSLIIYRILNHFGFDCRTAIALIASCFAVTWRSKRLSVPVRSIMGNAHTPPAIKYTDSDRAGNSEGLVKRASIKSRRGSRVKVLGLLSQKKFPKESITPTTSIMGIPNEYSPGSLYGDCIDESSQESFGTTQSSLRKTKSKFFSKSTSSSRNNDKLFRNQQQQHNQSEHEAAVNVPRKQLLSDKTETTHENVLPSSNYPTASHQQDRDIDLKSAQLSEKEGKSEKLDCDEIKLKANQTITPSAVRWKQGQNVNAITRQMQHIAESANTVSISKSETLQVEKKSMTSECCKSTKQATHVLLVEHCPVLVLGGTTVLYIEKCTVFCLEDCAVHVKNFTAVPLEDYTVPPEAFAVFLLEDLQCLFLTILIPDCILQILENCAMLRL
uniref:Uncharacterized protein n=1 Tax=Glossina pallidipes TaxID=7398 RepID=A0A1A9ZPS4_GLOPL